MSKRALAIIGTLAAAPVAALLSLAGAAAPANSLAENAVLLWFIWIIWASISLARGEREPAGAVSYRLSTPSAEKANASP